MPRVCLQSLRSEWSPRALAATEAACQSLHATDGDVRGRETEHTETLIPAAGRPSWTVLAPTKMRNQSRSRPGRQATRDQAALHRPCPNRASARQAREPSGSGSGRGRVSGWLFARPVCVSLGGTIAARGQHSSVRPRHVGLVTRPPSRGDGHWPRAKAVCRGSVLPGVWETIFSPTRLKEGIQKCWEPKAWLVALEAVTRATLSAGSRSLSLRLSQRRHNEQLRPWSRAVGKSAGTIEVAGSSGGDSLRTLQWEKAENNRWLQAPISLRPGAPGSGGEDGTKGRGRWCVVLVRPRRPASRGSAGQLGAPSIPNAAGHGRPLPWKGGQGTFLVLAHPCSGAGQAGREERDFRAAENLDSSPGSALGNVSELSTLSQPPPLHL